MNQPYNPADQRKIIERILKVWQAHPYLRLGQLIENATANKVDLFVIDNGQLAQMIEVYGDQTTGYKPSDRVGKSSAEKV